MDEAAIEQRGAQPLQPYFDQIDAMRSVRDLPPVLARLHMALADDGLFFSFGSGQDFADSSRVIAFANGGGIGLPDRDSYLKTDAKSAEIRTKYVAHIARMFGLLGESGGQARGSAAKVMQIETALARATLSRVDKRDPYKLFHKMNAKGLQALTPGFDWHAYLAALGETKLSTFNVTEPAFYKELGKQWRGNDLVAIKTYLRWHVARASAPALSPAFDNEHFDFFSRAGSAASRWSTRSSARRWARNSSAAPSARS
jgi:putative endopeptidase